VVGGGGSTWGSYLASLGGFCMGFMYFRCVEDIEIRRSFIWEY